MTAPLEAWDALLGPAVLAEVPAAREGHPTAVTGRVVRL